MSEHLTKLYLNRVKNMLQSCSSKVGPRLNPHRCNSRITGDSTQVTWKTFGKSTVVIKPDFNFLRLQEISYLLAFILPTNPPLFTYLRCCAIQNTCVNQARIMERTNKNLFCRWCSLNEVWTNPYAQSCLPFFEVAASARPRLPLTSSLSILSVPANSSTPFAAIEKL